MSRFTLKLWLVPSLLLVAVCFSIVPALRPPGAIGPYLNDVFSPEPPGEVSRYDVEDVFPGIGFQGPVRILSFPDSTQGLVIMGKRGQAWLANPETQETREILNISDRILNGWEGGSLGIAFHPDFATGGEREVFVFYRWKHELLDFTEEGYNRLSRFQWDEENQRVDADSEEVLLQQFDRKSWHAGGDMFFGPDGYLYLSLGDEGLHEQHWADSNQRLDRGMFGGIIRIDVDNDVSRSHPIRRQPLPPSTPPEGWPATFSAGYMIPNDNPWLDPSGGGLEEFIVLGARSPHAMFWDAVTEKIWLSDVGSDHFEEVNQTTIGDNLGWPWMEGHEPTGDFPRPDNVIGQETAPYLAYPHDVGNCVMGGGVYRGALFTNLFDHYVFADWGVNRLMAVNAIGGDREIKTLIGDITSLPHEFPPAAKLSGVYPQANGDILLTVMGSRLSVGPGKIYRLVKRDVVPDPPQRLSELGAFTNLATLEVAPGIIPYRTNAQLYSDGAKKLRWLVVPNDGTYDEAGEQIEFRADASWTFPEGTVFIKHFELPNAGGNLRLETRFFVLGAGGKGYGLTYRWNDEGTDAFLLQGSEERAYDLFDEEGAIIESGTWTFPSRTQCLTCHTNNSDYVLGVHTHQLNGDMTYPATGQTFNQLSFLESIGVLDGPVGDVNDLPKAHAIGDETASLELRVRSYLDANCASCHRPGGLEQVDMDLRFMTADPIDRRLISAPTRSHASNPDYNLVEPGDHSISEIWVRDASMGANQMPPLGRSKVDDVWVDRLAEWIDGLGEEEEVNYDLLVYPNPTTANITLQIPPDWTSPYQIHLYDVAGRVLQEAQIMVTIEELNVSAYPTGILLLTIEDADGRRVDRKVIKR